MSIIEEKTFKRPKKEVRREQKTFKKLEKEVRKEQKTFTKLENEVRKEQKSFKWLKKKAHKANHLRKIELRPLGQFKKRSILKKMAPLFLYINLFLFAFPPFLVPVNGPFTSTYFFRQKPDSPNPIDFEFHRGLDISSPTGTGIKVSAPGIVTATGYTPTAGNYVKVSHLFGFSTYYAHMSKINVKKGQLLLIAPFSVVGKVGSTGRSTGPHLHFEVRFFNFPLPPGIAAIHHIIRRGIFRF